MDTDSDFFAAKRTRTDPAEFRRKKVRVRVRVVEFSYYGVRGLPSAAIKVSRSSSTFEAPGRRRAQRARARAQSPRLFVRSIGRSSAEQDESRRSRRAASQTAAGETDRDATSNQRSISHARWNRILRAAGRREPRALRRRGHRYFAGAPTLPEKM